MKKVWISSLQCFVEAKEENRELLTMHQQENEIEKNDTDSKKPNEQIGGNGNGTIDKSKSELPNKFKKHSRGKGEGSGSDEPK